MLVEKLFVMWAENVVWEEREARKSICASSAWDDKSLELASPVNMKLGMKRF